MNKSSGGNSTVLLGTALILALLFAVYYYVVMPKQDEAAAKESSVNSLQTQITTLQQQIAVLEQEDSAEGENDPFILRKKVPNNRDVDALLLSIEEVEYVVGTRVQSINFNNYDSLVLESQLQDPNYTPPAEEGEATEATPAEGEETTPAQEEAKEEETTEGEATESETTEAPVSTIARENLPAELKLLTLSIAVDAPDYESLVEFIREVETLERVVRVDSIGYNLPGEEVEFDEEASEIVSAEIQVTTFYYEGE